MTRTRVVVQSRLNSSRLPGKALMTIGGMPLIELVARLEGGQAGLEESMRLWERGEALAAHCEAWLDKAEASLGSEGTSDEG